jgi:hypothetical protein
MININVRHLLAHSSLWLALLLSCAWQLFLAGWILLDALGIGCTNSDSEGFLKERLGSMQSIKRKGCINSESITDTLYKT